MDRRAFLRRAGAVGVTALVGGLAACSTNPSHPQAGGTTTTANGTTVGPPQWSVLAGMLSGTLVVPGDASYVDDALLYNEVLTPQPAAIAYCATAADVQRCVAYARAHGFELAPHGKTTMSPELFRRQLRGRIGRNRKQVRRFFTKWNRARVTVDRAR